MGDHFRLGYASHEVMRDTFSMELYIVQAGPNCRDRPLAGGASDVWDFSLFLAIERQSVLYPFHARDWFGLPGCLHPGGNGRWSLVWGRCGQSGPGDAHDPYRPWAVERRERAGHWPVE